jgi:hypothetical protein
MEKQNILDQLNLLYDLARYQENVFMANKLLEIRQSLADLWIKEEYYYEQIKKTLSDDNNI